jgi:LmbE family N-acetylglucosaminyl deacetylase
VLAAYLARLVRAQSRWRVEPAPARLHPRAVDVSSVFERKLRACSLYASQIRQFFPTLETAVDYYRAHARSVGDGALVERFWQWPARPADDCRAQAPG